MQFLSLTLETCEENLALDEALLLEAEAGRNGEVLRVWEYPKPAVVLGSGCRIAEDVEEAACARDQVPIGRRASGGGTVLLGSGCLLYSLVLALKGVPALRGIRSSYAFILERVCRALGGSLPGMERAGISDLAAAGRKFSGSAQRRKPHYVLHHGTLLYNFDLELLGRYLHLPSRQPEYRAGRDHAAFVRNLPLSRPELEHRLRSAWQADATLLGWPERLTRLLAAEKYARPESIRRALSHPRVAGRSRQMGN